jgi:hypothetical protein
VINARMQQFFFDRVEVQRRLKTKRLKAMRSAGAYARKLIRNKPVRRKRKSRPGEPPTVHTKDKYATLRNVQFAYSPSSDSVVVGPVKIGSVNAEPGQQVAPETLEYGGGSQRNKLWRKMEVGKSGPAEVDGKRGDKVIERGKRGGTGVKHVVGIDGEMHAVAFMSLRTPAQAVKAQGLHDEVWGPKFIKTNVEPRPFVAPAMRKAAEEFPEFYAKESSR